MGTLVAILTLIPTIIQIVRAVEEVAPISGQGKEKLDLVMGMVEEVANTSGVKDGDKKALVVALPGIVARVVSTLNALGVFKKG